MVVMEMVCTQSDSLSEEKSAVNRKVENEVREKAETAPGTIPYFCTGVSQNSQRKGDAPIVGKGDKRPHERQHSQRQKVTRKVANEVREKAATAPGTIPFSCTGVAQNSQGNGGVPTIDKGDKGSNESQHFQRQNLKEKSNDMRNDIDEARGKGAMPTKSTPPSASGEDISKTKKACQDKEPSCKPSSVGEEIMSILQRLGPYISLAKLGLMLFRRNPYAYCVVEVLDVLEILSVKQSGLDCIVGGAAAVIDKMMNSSSANTRALGAILHVILTIMVRVRTKRDT